MNECECRNCGYYYQDDDDDFPRCHYEDSVFPAPCEQEDDDDYIDDNDYEDFCDDEVGFDPYLGCYTDDC